MEVVPEPNIVSGRVKVYYDDPQWPEHIKNSQLKRSKSRGELLRMCINT